MDQRTAAPDRGDHEPDFIELPAPGPAGRSPSKPEQTGRSGGGSRKKPRKPLVVVDDTPEDLSWQERAAGWFTGEEGAGFGISLVAHLILLALLAIPIIREVQPGPIFSTVLTETADDEFTLAEPLDTELALPEPEGGGVEQFQLPDLVAEESRPITEALFPEASTAGEGAAIGAGAVAEGMRSFVPENAVTAGSFTAWTTPTFGHPDRPGYYPRRYGEPDPEPGDSPRPGQPYYITIQVEMPKGRRRYPLRDLSGLIIGTDRYRQELPEHTYVLDPDGKPVRPRSSTIPVVDGVVQFIVFVPGAQELVKDTIVVSSRLLEEEQTLELVFESPDDP